MLCCGRRFGKSILGEDRIIGPALNGLPVAWFSPDYKSLLENWRNLCKVLRPVTARKSEQEHRLDLITGGVIEFWALDKDPECSRGRKYARVVIDEAAKVRYLMRAWLESIRANLADYEGDAWFLSTPKGRNDFWQLYQRGVIGGEKHSDDWACWKRPTGDNPFIPASEIELMRIEMGAHIASQEIDAEFLEVGGRFFHEWDEEIHTCMPLADIPHFWNFFGGLDYGTRASSPSFYFVLMAANTFGDIYALDEIYLSGKTPTEMAVAVEAVLKRNGAPPGTLIAMDWANTFPPDKPEERVGEYPVEAFWARGLNCIPAVKNRHAGWARGREVLKGRRLAEDGVIVPKFRAVKGRCSHLIRTIPLQVYDERLGHLEDLDTEQEDHPVDGWRFALMTRPGPSGPDPSPDAVAQRELDRLMELLNAPPVERGNIVAHTIAQRRSGRGKGYA